MFYNQELLAKKNSGFAIAWLAATLNQRASSLKKLTKREITNTNLDQLCQQISVPAEPLALRLSASLLLGVARIYEHKVLIFLVDVENVSNNLKKYSQQVAKSNLASINMADTSKVKSITINASAAEVGRDACLARFDMENYDFMLYQYAEQGRFRATTPGLEEPGDDPEFTVEAAYGPGSAKKSSKKAKEAKVKATSNNTVDPSEINLKDQEEYDLDLAQPLNFDLGDDVYGFEQGFLDGNMLGLDMNPLGDNSSAQPYNMGVDFTAEIEGLGAPIDKVFSDVASLQSARDSGRKSPGRKSLLPARYAAEEELVNPMEMDIVYDAPPHTVEQFDQARETDEQDQRSQASTEKEGDTASEPKRKKVAAKKGKNTGVLLDDATSLDRQQYQAARQQYTEMLKAENVELRLKIREKECVEQAKELLYAPPPIFRNCDELNSLWKVLIPVGNRKRAVEEASGRGTKRKRDVSSKDKAGKNASERGGLEEPAEIGRTAGRARLSSFPMRFDPQNQIDGAEQYDPYGNHQDFDMGLPAEAEYAMPNFDQPFEDFGMEIGRRASHGETRQSGASLLPWNITDRVSLDGPDIPGSGSRKNSTGRISFRGESPFDAAFAKVSKAISAVGSGSPALRRTSRAGSIFQEGDTQLDTPLEMTYEAPNGHRVRLQQDSYNFLHYARDQTSGAGALFFSDVVPVAASTQAVAAQAFYHVLTLASNNFIKILGQQEDGEIELAVVG